MWKVHLVILTIIHFLIFQVHSKLVIENVTVSSDFIQDLFFEEIRSNPNFSDIFDSREVRNEQKCFDQLKVLAETFPSYNALRFVDAWGKLPSGLLSAHLTDLGNYDQCVKTSVVLIPSHGITNGKYCFASFPLLLARSMFPDSGDQNSTKDNDVSTAGYSIRTTLSIRIAVCIPDVCNSAIVNRILKKSVGRSLNGLLSLSSVSNCSVAKKPDFKTIDIIAIVIYSFIGLLMLLSTLYDIATVYFHKKPVPLLLAFSVVTNGKKIIAINTEKSSNSIDCLNGLRVLSLFWVINCHNYGFYAQLNVSNIVVATNWANSFWSLTILMGTVSVDTFFMISGLLVAWLGLRELDKTNGKINIALMYIHRYIRLTPAIAAIILFYVSLNKHIGSGPFRDPSKTDCDTEWWYSLLYIQNYAQKGLGCVAQSWYLACDTQLYLLSPLILWPLWKWGKKTIPAIVILVLLSIGCVIGTYYVYGYTSLLGFAKPLGSLPRTYTRTHTRYSPWLVGIVLGYILYVNRKKTIRLSTIVQIAGWVASVGTMLCITFLPYYASPKFPYDSSVFFAAIYESFKRFFWAIAIAWIVFVCHFNYGGFVNTVLSHPLWQPFGRLNYCMYIVHCIVQELKYHTSKTDVYFSNNIMFFEFFSTLGATIIAALVLSLSFEAPLMTIEKAIFGRRKAKSESVDNLVVHPLPESFESKQA